MNPEDISKLYTLISSFGFGIVVSAVITFYFIRHYIPSYLSQKGKNLATKEDIALITNEVESVKSGYAEILEEIKLHNQIKISAIEQEKIIKKEVYMDAVEAVTHSQNMIANMANLNISEEQISASSSKHAGKIAKIHIVGTEKTVQAITQFSSELGTQILNLMLERSLLIQRKNSIQASEHFRDKAQAEVERYINIMKELNLTGNTDKKVWEYIEFSLDFQNKEIAMYNLEIQSLNETQRKEHIDFTEKCMDTFFNTSTLLPKAILSIRSELGLQISTDEYLEIYNTNIKNSKKYFNDFIEGLKKTDALIYFRQPNLFLHHNPQKPSTTQGRTLNHLKAHRRQHI